MSIKVDGAKELEDDIEDLASYLTEGVEATLQDWGNEVVAYARKHHKFGNPYSKGYKERTGNANRSMQADAKGAVCKIWINPEFVSVPSKKYGTFNYAMALHDGTKDADGNALIDADPFLENAIEKKLGKINGMIGNMVDKVMK